jgi:major membrane immunogen (membrane-anchored lipoprotein)
MRNFVCLLALLGLASLAFGTVAVSAPANGASVSTTVQYVASATTSCAAGVAAIGIYSTPGNLVYSTSGKSLNTSLTFAPGTYPTVVQEWDNCGGTSSTPVTIKVSGASSQVVVATPKNNATVAPQVQFVANASSSCAKGVSAMGIYTSSGTLAYHSAGANLNTLLNLNPGTYHTVVQEWDNCGGSAYTPVTIQVGGTNTGGGNVTVSAPQVNSNVGNTIQYVASASSSCGSGIAAMGIYTAPGVLAYKTAGGNLNTLISLANGEYHTVVQEWDNCGGSAVSAVPVTVGSASGTGVFTNLQAQQGWNGYALLPTLYEICSGCAPSGPQTTWSMTQNVSSPSLSGNASKMAIGGQTVYSDVLWNNHLIGDFSTQGMPDPNQTIVPNLHNFTYDVYFYANNLSVSQALEFDINQFVGGNSYIWGHECRVAGGNEWDIWDDPSQTWWKTGIPCNPVANAWNHLVLQVQRTSDNQLLFQSITLNGVTSTLNHYENPTPTTWYGVTINYQQDGNYAQNPYAIWLDKVNFTYW